MADGASESLLAGRWAHLLATAACRYDPRALRRAIRWAAARWPQEVERWLADRDPPWWVSEKLRRGAYATLVVVQLGPDGQWRAAAVGDSCLLQLRGDRIERAFPLTEPTSFNAHPPLIGSASAADHGPMHTTGLCRPSDQLLLATDALAAWLLSVPEEVPDLLKDITDGGAAAFAARTGQARRSGALRDDDLTLVVVDHMG